MAVASGHLAPTGEIEADALGQTPAHLVPALPAALTAAAGTESSAGRSSSSDRSWDSGDFAAGRGPEAVTGSHGGAARDGTGARLLAPFDACGNYFPAQAEADRGSVRVQLQVNERGQPQVTQVLSESPRGQGFDAAARACARRLRFSPARDGQGLAVVGTAKLELQFRRL